VVMARSLAQYAVTSLFAAVVGIGAYPGAQFFIGTCVDSTSNKYSGAE